MPCTYDPLPDNGFKTEGDIKRRNDLDNLTRMLCGLCGAIEHNGLSLIKDLTLDDKFAAQISTWWELHRDWDQKRLAAAKQSALSKLNDDEKEALGL